ncbi:flagellar biosynthetic protein FliO [Paenibacillus sp. YYML68]|uniref:flagellar biosynthetic protein FliO n=1 Tax=Paenibacillus sp. YYML68 TaxID=2909250 RepID=UPI00248FF70F|nr:flagellar biosynthetic protein FliO [Paenibacillus sp. YYML68]
MKRLDTKTLLAVFIGLLLSAVFAAVCFGETGTDAPGSSPFDSPDSFVSAGDTFGMIVKVIFFLIIIIVIFYVIMKVLAQKNHFFAGRSLRSLGGVPLGQNKSIQIVEIGNALYIVGVGDNIQLLEKIQDEEQVAMLRDMMTIGPSVSGASFESVGEWLNKLRRKPVAEEELDVQDTSFQHVFQSKMSDRKKMMEELLKQDSHSEHSKDNR